MKLPRRPLLLGAGLELARVLGACASPEPLGLRRAIPADPLSFLRSRLTPYGRRGGQLSLTETNGGGRVAVYDTALTMLCFTRRGMREEAGALVRGLHALQASDGSFPFSFTLPGPAGVPYIRSGAIAWAGYAVLDYLDADAGGAAREEALAVAAGAARYLQSVRVQQGPGDPRTALVRGGSGRIVYRWESERLYEEVQPGAIPWASVEHNIDAFFFFRTYARVAGRADLAIAAEEIRAALVREAWSGATGQLARGIGPGGADTMKALDCASWGALFLAAAGERARAELAASIADSRYASKDPDSGARGHLPYADAPVLEEAVLREHSATIGSLRWDELAAVWPEGSAGVALAAWRSGRGDRANEILRDLEPLRAVDGSLPTFTREIPYNFDTRPSVAGTAWVELARFEMSRPTGRQTLWI